MRLEVQEGHVTSGLPVVLESKRGLGGGTITREVTSRARAPMGLGPSEGCLGVQKKV